MCGLIENPDSWPVPSADHEKALLPGVPAFFFRHAVVHHRDPIHSAGFFLIGAKLIGGAKNNGFHACISFAAAINALASVIACWTAA